MKSRRTRRTAARPLPPAKAGPGIARGEATLMLLKGLNFLLAQADRANLTPAARILAVARGELAVWAAAQTDANAPSDTFIYQALAASGLFPAAELILHAKTIQCRQTRQAILALAGAPV